MKKITDNQSDTDNELAHIRSSSFSPEVELAHTKLKKQLPALAAMEMDGNLFNHFVLPLAEQKNDESQHQCIGLLAIFAELASEPVKAKARELYRTIQLRNACSAPTSAESIEAVAKANKKAKKAETKAKKADKKNNVASETQHEQQNLRTLLAKKSLTREVLVTMLVGIRDDKTSPHSDADFITQEVATLLAIETDPKICRLCLEMEWIKQYGTPQGKAVANVSLQYIEKMAERAKKSSESITKENIQSDMMVDESLGIPHIPSFQKLLAMTSGNSLITKMIEEENAALDVLKQIYDIAYHNNTNNPTNDDLIKLTKSINSPAFWEMLYKGFLHDRGQLFLQTIKRFDAFKIIFPKMDTVFENKDVKMEKIFEKYKMPEIDQNYLEKYIIPILEEKENNTKYDNARRLLILCKKSRNEDVQSFAERNLEKYPSISPHSESVSIQTKIEPDKTKIKEKEESDAKAIIREAIKAKEKADELAKLKAEREVEDEARAQALKSKTEAEAKAKAETKAKKARIRAKNKAAKKASVEVEEQIVSKIQEEIPTELVQECLPYKTISLKPLSPNDLLFQTVKKLEDLTGHDVFVGGSTPINTHINEMNPDRAPLKSHDWDFRIVESNFNQNDLFEILKTWPEVVKCKNITKTDYPIIRLRVKMGEHIQKIEIAIKQKKHGETPDEAMIRTLNEESDTNVSSMYSKVMDDGKVELRGSKENLESYLAGYINIVGNRETVFKEDVRRLLRFAMKQEIYELKEHQELKDILKAHPPHVCFNQKLKEPKQQKQVSTFLQKTLFSRYSVIEAIELLHKHGLFEALTGLSYESIKDNLLSLSIYNNSHPYTKRLAFYVFLLAHKSVQIAKSEYIPDKHEAAKKVEDKWQFYKTAKIIKTRDHSFLNKVIDEIIVGQIRDVKTSTFSKVITSVSPSYYEEQKAAELKRQHEWAVLQANATRAAHLPALRQIENKGKEVIPTQRRGSYLETYDRIRQHNASLIISSSHNKTISRRDALPIYQNAAIDNSFNQKIKHPTTRRNAFFPASPNAAPAQRIYPEANPEMSLLPQSVQLPAPSVPTPFRGRNKETNAISGQLNKPRK